MREQLKKQGIHHVVVLPVQGKKSMIGTLSLAMYVEPKPQRGRTRISGDGQQPVGDCRRESAAAGAGVALAAAVDEHV